MAKPKQPKEPSATKTSSTETTETKDRYTTILLEEMRSQFQLVAEESQSTKSFLSQRMAEDKKEICDRLGIIESVVRMHSGQLVDLKKEIQDVRTELGGKIDRWTDKIERHDDDIATLKEANLR